MPIRLAGPSSAIAGLLLLALPAAAAVVDFASPHASYATGSAPDSVAIGRLDADARPDLVACNYGAASISILLQNPDGTFGPKADLASLNGPASVAIIDLDNDGKRDVVVACNANGGPGGVCVFKGHGDGTFEPRADYAATYTPNAMRVVDMDGDGILDVLAGGGAGLIFLKGSGTGTLGTAVPILNTMGASSVAVGHLDGDATLDVVISGPRVLLGNGDGTFAAPVLYSTGLATLSVGVGDYDGDGKADIVVSNPAAGSMSILLNQGDGVFGPHREFATGNGCKSVIPIDLDGDSLLDVVMVNPNDATIGVLRGKGDGTFQTHVGYLTGSGPYVDAAGDLNGDNLPDVVAANQGANTLSVLIQGVGAAPPAVANLAVGQVADTSLTLTWTAPAMESATLGDGYELRFSTAPIVTAGDFAAATLVLPRPLLRPSGQAVTGVVAGLAPGTLYYVAVRSTDALGRASAPSNVVSATTAASDLIAPATPVLSSAPVYDTSLVLAWTAPGDDGNVGTAAAYDLRMSSAPINAGNFAAATPIATAAPKAAGGAERVVVAGLAPGTTYHFALQVADEVPRLSGLATDSDTTAASDTTAPSRVTDLAASAAISDGFTLTWTAPGDDAAIGSATLYDIRIAATTIATTPAFLAAAPLAGAPAPQPAGTLQTLVVTGLAPATTYHLALRAADEVPNAGAVSNAVSITTAPPPSGGGASAGSGGGGGGCGLGGLAAALLALSLLRWRRLH